MRKTLWLWAVLLLWGTSLMANPKKEVQHLKTLAQVWGFLKYYHPEAAKGNPDWDQELLKMIPLAQQATSDAAFDNLLTQWYTSLPNAKLAPRPTQAQNDSTKRVFHEKELKAFKIPKPLQATLLTLYRQHLPDSSKYITNRYKEYTLDYILHLENGFDQPSYPDEAHRLLALFRYWNIINYFYPHKATAAPHWDKVLTAYISLFRQAADAKAYQKTFLQLTAELKDSHSFFSQPDWDKEYNQLDLPFRVYFAQGKYFIGESRYDSLMQVHDFRIGDQIIGINNQSIKERTKALASVTTGTNNLSVHRNLGNALFKTGSETKVQVTLKRGKERLHKQVRLYTGAELYRYRLRNKPTLWQQVEPGVWHVKFCAITSPDTLQRLFQDIQSAKAVIWDMRDYPSYQVVQAVHSAFFTAPTVAAVNYNAALGYPGTFSRNLESTFAEPAARPLPFFAGKLIVLVNEHTQSLAESFTASLRLRPNTIVMGRQTAGTTGNILFVPFPGGIRASFTGVGVEGTQGTFTQGKGVKIDRRIRLSGKKLSGAKDYALKEALKEIAKG